VDRASRQTGDDAFVTKDDVLHGIIPLSEILKVILGRAA
jgi:hypothetical protein